MQSWGTRKQSFKLGSLFFVDDVNRNWLELKEMKVGCILFCALIPFWVRKESFHICLDNWVDFGIGKKFHKLLAYES